ncbi:YafY family protein [Amycolatopsis sp. 195334CR]|uniref:helix-turn-helix transcriptional regulator n=1 Tax=Amycolatopsis sp. 195334CR TaxID=2814588 RepID=UPI001A8D6210|nr:YafY family protein [Amycolatopsis sp. 195334CR]MBN6034263.1 YafY family transcriptional regulator [Amycolatopsis sp. 195334CR]
MRASRLVSMLLLLQARGRMTARELAAELEVSVRTIYRDAESLHAAGIPLYGDAGPAGGYQLLDGYRTRLTGLTAAEAETLFLTGLPGPAAELGLAQVAGTAQLKVLAAMPAELRERTERIASRFHLDAPGWYSDAEETPHLAAVADAVWTQRVLHVRYHRWREPRDVERTLEPYGLVLKAGRWYLVANSGERTATYRVNQILELSEGERFDRPPEFDLAAYWSAYRADFLARRRRGAAVIRLSPLGVEQFADTYAADVVKAFAESSGEPGDDGWVTGAIPIESIAYTAGDLLRLGPEVEVLDPPELRDRITELVDGLSKLYDR